MDALKKLMMIVGAVGAALALLAGPVVAEEEPAEEAPSEEPAQDEADADEGEADAEAPAEGEGEADAAEGEAGEGDRIPIADTPRARIGLILFGALLLAGGAAAANARRQLKGERPQASGEFRWR